MVTKDFFNNTYEILFKIYLLKIILMKRNGPVEAEVPTHYSDILVTPKTCHYFGDGHYLGDNHFLGDRRVSHRRYKFYYNFTNLVQTNLVTDYL